MNEDDAALEDDNLQLLMGRPILNVSDELLNGYLILESEERRFTAFALQRHPELVTSWYELLTLFAEAIEGVRQRRRPTGPETLADALRLRFLAASGGTAKLVLDATLAGYYTQAFSLIRHLFETWIRLEYVRHNPEAAGRWFESPDGAKPQPPKESKMLAHLRQLADYPAKPVLERVVVIARSLNVMAHPSEHTLQQTVGVRDNVVTIGANYDPDLAPKALHEGGNAFRLVVTSTVDTLAITDDWKLRFIAATTSFGAASSLEVSRREQRTAPPAETQSFERSDPRGS